MMDTPTLVRVRFLTSRGSLCGVHVTGFEYDLPVPFARQVVEQEHVAEYVTPAPVSSRAGTVRARKTR